MYDPQKRTAEIDEVLRKFQAKSEREGDFYTYKENASTLIRDAYEMLLFGPLKESHVDETNINIYKVASGIELATNFIRPIQTTDVYLFEALNAQLASDIAFSFVFSKKMTNVDISLNESEDLILLDHHEILTYSVVESIFDTALLTNALFWRAFYLCVFQRITLENLLSK